MSMSDTISDLLTRLRNAQNSSKENVSIPFSKMKHSICQVLLNEGYIDKIDIDDSNKKNLSARKGLLFLLSSPTAAWKAEG